MIQACSQDVCETWTLEVLSVHADQKIKHRKGLSWRQGLLPLLEVNATGRRDCLHNSSVLIYPTTSLYVWKMTYLISHSHRGLGCVKSDVGYSSTVSLPMNQE